MFAVLRKFMSSKPTTPAQLSTDIKPYLPQLYVKSRQILFQILLGEAVPPKTPFPVDPEQTAEILQRIETLIASDEHLDGCRAGIGMHFPGRLAVLFNLAGRDDKLFPTDLLRESIRSHVQRHHAGLSGHPLDDSDLEAIEELKGSSRLQQQLASLVDFTPNKWLLEQEIPFVVESRKRRLGATGNQPVSQDAVPGAGSFPHRDDAYLWSRDTGRLRGLCFSGGGIRSATFNLGILQGMAKKNLLRQFDYCSSVSGGGYIHQWLAAWIKREEALHADGLKTPGLDAVCQHLIPQPDAGCDPLPPDPIRWLRRYSNYLTPQMGLSSADFWVTIAIWIRNTLLNQIILISLLLSLLLVPHAFVLRDLMSSLPKIGEPPKPTDGLYWARVMIPAIMICAATIYLLLVRCLAAGLNAARKAKEYSERLSERDLRLCVVLPALVVSLVVSLLGFYFKVPGLSETEQATRLCVLAFLGLLVLSFALIWAGGARKNRLDAERGFGGWAALGFVGAAVLAALVGTGIILLARNVFVTGSPIQFCAATAAQTCTAKDNPKISVQMNTGDSQQVSLPVQVVKSPAVSPLVTHTPNLEDSFQWRSVVVFGPLVVMLVPFLAIILQCGLIGHDFEDWVLEWLARVRAWVTLYSLTWTLIVGISLFGHQIVELLVRNSSNWIKWPVLGSWLLTTAGSVLAGKSSASSGGPNSAGNSRAIRVLTTVGPPVYILGLLLSLAWVAEQLLSAAAYTNDYFSSFYRPAALCGLILVPIIFLLFGWRVDINEFSMHSYYRNRLARCYLGASNAARHPDPITGFDTKDVEDLRLSTFLPSQGYTGPLPIFCASLNISVGEDLAWQERKAASFAFTPVLSGYYVPWTGLHYKGQLSYNGFVPTERFAYPNKGIHISTVAAISGAAISPNWGYHTSPPMAFLLTMFNVRLGWWLENPRRSFLAFDPKGQPPPHKNPFPRPRFAPIQLLQELLGQIGDAQDFVYLTDGGHFDNMGLYELVRRRCYEIVICDAEQDSGPIFEGIGMAIRKCRIDFGAEIDLDLSKLACDASKISKVHWITGTVKYPETSNGKLGTVLYIKSSITGNEAGDVYNYRLQNTPFPQDSTMDQWFTESQFESYRRLGQQVVDECPYLVRT
jgi:hypothetical protein